ncbi:glucose-6-phosphate dehydrogenase [Quadrisphaera sp. DSM 44207]|uniref:glucose-6-phosphate dehydrogenase n=1 Tax=Quadrisphaera sp. DSM 44207 TaxID=1881057 RepID=UPI00088225E7|nr:glucose-6-phosphate dehydrogenase [Quadrisphaera sp. DSM 44207]SDQ44728.1 glucose-6-phosphate 1-dehydrogenase [Quadrisphaera sp. DSM 44207]
MGPAPVATLLVLGATGDLTARLLLPGLGSLLAAGRAEPLQLVGAGTEDWDDARWRSRVHEAFAGAPGGAPAAVAGAARYVRADVTDGEQLRALLASCQGPVAVYFALPPAVTVRACEELRRAGAPDDVRLVLEKPFGTDLASARHLNEVVAAIAPEDRVHRVDHFLGMSTVLNTLGLRFANRIFEPLWSAAHVARVDVVFDEDLALEGRAGYYDAAGALVDMLQSHLLQVMALLAMDPPSTLGERDLRDRKGEVLRATRLAGPPQRASRRARYTAGRIGERDLPDYAAEPGVDPDRGTETLAEVVLHVDSWRWAGVPFRLRSGKALGSPRQEAVVTFADVPHVPAGLRGTPPPSRLRLGFSPDRVALDLAVNSEGDPYDLEGAQLAAELGASELLPYGEVLAGVLAGDATLSVRGDNVEECWRILEPVLAAWRAGEVPLEGYPAGSDGPAPREGFPAL